MLARAKCIAFAAMILTAEAAGSGFYNMPTSLQQCLGIGFGPGYHAPLVLGPMLRGSVEQKPIRRVRRPFVPPCDGAGFAAPTRWEGGCQEMSAPGWESFTGEMPPGGHSQPDYSGQPLLTAPYQMQHQGMGIAPLSATRPAASGAEVIPAPQATR